MPDTLDLIRSLEQEQQPDAGPAPAPMLEVSDQEAPVPGASRQKSQALIGELKQAGSEENTRFEAFSRWKASRTDVAPEQAREVLMLSEALDAEPEWVQRNLPDLKKEVDAKDLADQLARRPRLAAFMQDAIKAPLVKDDVANLGWLEWGITGQWELVPHRLWQANISPGLPEMALDIPVPTMRLAPAWARAARDAGVEQRVTYLSNRQYQGKTTPGEDDELDHLEAQYSGKDYGADNFASKALIETARMWPYLVGRGIVGEASGAAGKAAAIGLNATRLGGPWTQFIPAVTGLVGGMAFDYYQNVGPLYRQLKKLEGPDGKPLLTQDEAHLYAGAASGFAALTTSGLTGMGASALYKRSGVMAIDRLLRQAPERVGVGEFLKRYGIAVGAGATGMATQAATNQTSIEIAKSNHGLEFDKDAIFTAFGDAFVTGLQGMSLLAAWGPGRAYLEDRGRHILSAEEQARLEVIAQAAKNSEFIQKTPGEAEKLIASMDAGNVFVSLKQFDLAAKEAKADPAELAARIMDDEGAAYRKAHETGAEDLAIPASKYFSKLGRTELFDALRPDIRLSQDGLSGRKIREAQDRIVARAKELKALPPDQWDGDVRKVYDDYYNQARKGWKADHEEADAVAKTVAAFFETKAQEISQKLSREGQHPVTAWDIYQRQTIKLRLGAEKPGATPDAPVPNAAPEKPRVAQGDVDLTSVSADSSSAVEAHLAASGRDWTRIENDDGTVGYAIMEDGPSPKDDKAAAGKDTEGKGRAAEPDSTNADGSAVRSERDSAAPPATPDSVSPPKQVLDAIRAETEARLGPAGELNAGAEFARLAQTGKAKEWFEEVTKNKQVLDAYTPEALQDLKRGMELSRLIFDRAYDLELMPEEYTHLVDEKGKPILDEKGNKQPVSPFRSNEDFEFSWDLTTICPRQDEFVATIVDVERAIGQILTPLQRTLVSVMVAQAKGQPACWYCYGQAGRNAYDAIISKASKVATAYIAEAQKTKGKLTEAQLTAIFKPTSGAYKWSETSKPAKWLADNWKALAKAGVPNEVALRDAARGYASGEGGIHAEFADLLHIYASNSTKANDPKPWASMRTQLLSTEQAKIDRLNARAGLRLNSQTDFRPWQALELAQLVTLAKVRNLKAHVYAKEADFLRIYGKTGIKFNLSALYKVGEDGRIEVDSRGLPVFDGVEGMKGEDIEYWIKELPHDAGGMLVAINDEALWLGLKDGRIHQIIPYHSGPIPAATDYFRNARNYSRYQAERWSNARRDKVVKGAVKPIKEMQAPDGSWHRIGTEIPVKVPGYGTIEVALGKSLNHAHHQSDFKRYMALTEALGVVPKFWDLDLKVDGKKTKVKDLVEDGRLTQDEYMKLIRDVAREPENQRALDPAGIDWEAMYKLQENWIDTGGDQLARADGKLVKSNPEVVQNVLDRLQRGDWPTVGRGIENEFASRGKKQWEKEKASLVPIPLAHLGNGTVSLKQGGRAAKKATSPASSDAALAQGYHDLGKDLQHRTYWTDANTGLYSARAVEAMPIDPELPYLVEVDFEGKKAANDLATHEGLDALFRAGARAINGKTEWAGKVGGAIVFPARDAAHAQEIAKGIQAAMPTGFQVDVAVAERKQGATLKETMGALEAAGQDAKDARRLAGDFANRGDVPVAFLDKDANGKPVASPVDKATGKVQVPKHVAKRLGDALAPLMKDMAPLPQDAFAIAPALLEKSGQLSHADLAEGIHLERGTGLRTLDAWQYLRKKNRKEYVASLDLAFLRDLDQALGHGAADNLIAIFGRALAGHTDFDFAHLHGDEYAGQHDDKVLLKETLDALKETLRDRTFYLRRGDGSVVVQRGVYFGAAVAKTWERADGKALLKDKENVKATAYRPEVIPAERADAVLASLPDSALDLGVALEDRRGDGAESFRRAVGEATGEGLPSGERAVAETVGPRAEPRVKSSKVEVEYDRNRTKYSIPGDPDKLVLTVSSENNSVEFLPEFGPDEDVFGASLEVRNLDTDEVFGGRGYSTALYLRALKDAQESLGGWRSDSILSEASERMYERLAAAGVPFRRSEQHEYWYITSEDLAKVDLEQVEQRVQSRAREENRLYQGDRGETVFTLPNGQKRSFELRRLAGADRSTLAHESMHMMSEVLHDLAVDPSAPASIKRDYDTLLQWMGHTSPEERVAATRERVALDAIENRTPEQEARRRELEGREEKVTYAWEKFLLNGEAPRADLAGVFRRYQIWLTRIYKGAEGIDSLYSDKFGKTLDLTPEVRDVFRRLIASEEEIKKAQAAIDSQPFTPPAFLQQMSQEEREAYEQEQRTLSEAARIAAQAELNTRIAVDQQHENQQWFGEERERFRAEVELELDRNPTHQALRFLSSGEVPWRDSVPATLLAEDGQPLKLDRKELAKRYGKEFVRTISQKHRGIFGDKDHAASADEIAASLGLPDVATGDALVRAIQAAEPRKAIVERQVQERLEKLYGPALLDAPAKLLDEAIDTATNPAELRNVLSSIRALRKILDRGVADAPLLTKEQAERLAGRQEDLGSPEKFLKRERAAADKAAETGKPAAADEMQTQRAMADAAGREKIAREQVLEDAQRIADVSRQAQEMRQEEFEADVLKTAEQIRKADDAAARDRAFRPLDIEIETMKKQADVELRSMKIRDLQPEYFLGQANKAAREAMQHAAAGTWSKVSEKKQAQLENLVMHRAARELRGKMERAQAFLEARTSDSYRAGLGKASPEFLAFHDAILVSVGVTNEALPVGEQLKALARLEEFAKLDEQDLDFDVDAIRELLATPTAWKDLTPDQAQNVIDAVVQARTIAKSINEVTLEGEKIDLNDLARELIADVSRLPDKGKAPGDKAAVRPLAAGVKRVRGMFAGADGAMLDPVTIFSMLGEKWRARIYDSYVKQAVYRDHLAETVGKFFVEVWEKLPNEMMQQRFDYVDGIEKALPFADDLNLDNGPRTRQWLWMVALNMGNESNRERLLGGFKWSEKDVLRALDKHMTKAEWEFVQSVWKLSDEKLWPLMEAKEARRTGLPPKKIKATPIQTQHGEFSGGYFPAKYSEDAAIGDIGERQAEAASDRMSRPTFIRASTAKSHTKKRAEHYENVIDLDFNVVPSHLGQVIHDLAFDEYVRSVNRILYHPAVANALKRRLGKERATQPYEWMKYVASEGADPIPKSLRELNGIIAAGKSRLVTAALGWNIRNAGGDLPTALVSAVIGEGPGGIGPQFVAPIYARTLALAVTPFGWREMGRQIEAAKAFSPEMNRRLNNAARDTREKLMEIGRAGQRTKAGKALHAVQMTSFFVHQQIEKMTLLTLVQAARWKAESRGATPEEASLAADHAIQDLMPSAEAAEKSAMIRDTRGMGAMMAMFGFFNKSYSLVRRIAHEPYMEFSKGDVGGGMIASAKAAGAAIAMFSLTHALGEYISGRGPEDDETTGEWYLRKMLAAPGTLIPGGSMISEPASSLAVTGSMKPVSERAAPGLAMFSRTLQTIGKLASEGRDADDKVWDAIEAMLWGLKLQARQIRKTGQWIEEVATGDEKVRSVRDVKGIVDGPPRR